MEKETARRFRISQSLIGNTHRLGHRVSEETKRKQSLALKGKWAWNKGLRASDSTRHKMSLSRTGVPHPWMRRTPTDDTKSKLATASKRAWNNPEIRKKYYDALQKTQWLNVRTDKGQLDLLNKWNLLGFQFQPNYQVRTETDLFYVDGYDPIRNVILEYDGKYHHKPGQKEKDELRQQKILDALKPRRFWRYDASNKTFQDIVG